MKKTLSLLCLASLISLLGIQNTMANFYDCRCNYYLAGRGGLSWHDKIKFVAPNGDSDEFKYKIGRGGSIAYGKNFNEVRLEIEGAVHYNRIEKATRTQDGLPSVGGTGYVRDEILTFNAFYDFNFPKTCFSLYVGGGLGVSFHHRKFSPIFGLVQKRRETLVVWQAMAGFTYELWQYIDIDFGYRLIGMEEPSSPFGTSAVSAPLINNLELGIRVQIL